MCRMFVTYSNARNWQGEKRRTHKNTKSTIHTDKSTQAHSALNSDTNTRKHTQTHAERGPASDRGNAELSQLSR